MVTQYGINNKPKLGVSSCLLGAAVRHDGGHKHNRYLTETLKEFFEFIPVCPESDIGLGTPREALHLEGRLNDIRVRGNRNHDHDVTDLLRNHGKKMASQINDLSGYIFKSHSPSCGLEHVSRRPSVDRNPIKDGIGQYAAAFIGAQPLLPVEEEGCLQDPTLRENFFERVFVFQRWLYLSRLLDPKMLVEFHTGHKLLILAHGAQALRQLGQLVAQAGSGSIEKVGCAYITQLMQTLKNPATRKGHTNALQHMQGYLKERIDQQDRVELAELIENYRLGRIPLAVPLTLLRHHFLRHPNSYIAGQFYLNSHTRELMLRNLI